MEKHKDDHITLNGGLTWTKLITLLLTVIVGTMGSNVAFRIADPPAPDRFTGKDSKILRAEIEQQISQEVITLRNELRESEQRKPPSATRTRIRALEDFVEETHPEFSKPTEDWQ